MHWLGLDYDEGPIYQMQRLDALPARWSSRCSRAGTAYRCYCTPEELDAMREAQRARGEKPRYDGRWRPEPGKALPPVPEGVQPVMRFRNPHRRQRDAGTTWSRARSRISNDELDDLVIARAATARADLQLLRRRRRLGHAHHARLPRRRARQQHAVADQHLPRARRRAAACSATCRSSSATTARSCRSAAAPSA